MLDSLRYLNDSCKVGNMKELFLLQAKELDMNSRLTKLFLKESRRLFIAISDHLRQLVVFTST